MKPLKQFLNYLLSFSEEARKFIAIAGTAILAVVIFSFWMRNTSSHLAKISFPDQTLSQQPPLLYDENKKSAALGPTAGIAESLRSLEFVIPKFNPKSLVGGIEMNDAYDYYNQTEKSAKKVLAAVYETIYGWADKIGMKMYTP